MANQRFLYPLAIFFSITFALSARGDIFTETGLVHIPTGRVLKHGIFGAGPSIGLGPTSENSTAIRLNFGLFHRVEIGLKHRWNSGESDTDTEQAASLKVQLLNEQEVGVVPNVAIGVTQHSDRFFGGDSDTIADEAPTAFFTVSKTFNLPRIHQFVGHIGIGTERFAAADRPLGLFAGLSKTFQPAFARGDITFALEFDGVGVNTGVRYITTSGLQVAMGAERVNSPDRLGYLVAVSWSNARILEQIAETRRLITQATTLVIAAKRARVKRSEE